MITRAVTPPSLGSAIGRVFDVALPHTLWSRRSLLLLFLAGGPVLVALAIRLASLTNATFVINGKPPAGADIFGTIVWLAFVRFIVPTLGAFYGTSLIADEVEDKTITYLFMRPVARRAVLLGKYLAYLACTILVVLPAVVLVFFLIVPTGGSALADEFPALVADLGMLAVGLAAYGALFAWIGARVRRPLISGLAFVLAWEPLVLLFPGYLKRLTVAYYLQALVKHEMPKEAPVLEFLQVFSDVPAVGPSLAVLAAIIVIALWLGSRAVERREYVLDQ